VNRAEALKEGKEQADEWYNSHLIRIMTDQTIERMKKRQKKTDSTTNEISH